MRNKTKKTPPAVEKTPHCVLKNTSSIALGERIGTLLWQCAVGDSVTGHLESELSEWLTTELPSPDGALFLSPPPQRHP